MCSLFDTQIYFEAIETVIGCIEKRFEQNDNTNYYSKLENLLLYSARGEPYEELLSFICKFYKEDINKGRLEAQLPSLKELFKDEDQINISNIIKTFRNMSEGIREYYSEVIVLIKLVLVAPATNSVSERSCSTLRRIKTYLRTTMSQNRLNNTIILHTYKEELDKLDMIGEANEFCRENDERKNTFRKFSKRDLPTVYAKKVSVATQT